jgi:hypothetical protein
LRHTFLKDLKDDDFTCNFFKRHKYEGGIALIIMVSLMFLAVGVFAVYKFRSRVLPCWYGSTKNYDALHEEDDDDDDDDDESGDGEGTVTFHKSSSVSNDKVGFRLANGHNPPPAAV